MALAGSSAVEPDIASELLVAELALNDTVAVQAARKGKARIDAPRSDEEIAFSLQAASLGAFITAVHDHQFASSIDRAIESDASQLRRLTLLEWAEHDDRRAAVALRDGHDLPSQTMAQRRMERSCTQPAGESSSARHGDASSTTSEVDTRAIESKLENVRISTVAPETVRQPPKIVEKSLECVICRDGVVASRSFKAPQCTHYYCRGCIVNLVEAALRDETLHPLRCCQQLLPLVLGVFKFISISLQRQFLAKNREYSVPASSRAYCSNPRCSAFLGVSGDWKHNLTCSDCRTVTCSECKEGAHPGENCADRQRTVALQEIARANKWQTCPGCRAIVELSYGCYHIVCRCGTQFCYLCAARWRTCDCPHWDEARLLNDAERRVRNEFGHRAAAAQPAVHAERVQRSLRVLRENHECRAHSWMYRSGAGQCEECGDYLGMYLMRCSGCQALVCRRCSVNRL